MQTNKALPPLSGSAIGSTAAGGEKSKAVAKPGVPANYHYNPATHRYEYQAPINVSPNQNDRPNNSMHTTLTGNSVSMSSSSGRMTNGNARHLGHIVDETNNRNQTEEAEKKRREQNAFGMSVGQYDSGLTSANSGNNYQQ